MKFTENYGFLGYFWDGELAIALWELRWRVTFHSPTRQNRDRIQYCVKNCVKIEQICLFPSRI
ncbi:MAG: hypothetical protein VKK42_30475 [Lyngbya sp.]|nr:hypothetical protein [Lyngbya sp.]